MLQGNVASPMNRLDSHWPGGKLKRRTKQRRFSGRDGDADSYHYSPETVSNFAHGHVWSRSVTYGHPLVGGSTSGLRDASPRIPPKIKDQRNQRSIYLVPLFTRKVAASLVVCGLKGQTNRN